MAQGIIKAATHVTHGLGLAQAALPEGCNWLGRKLVQFRRVLEAACRETHGQTTLTHALAVDAAVAWERHRQLCYRWLRKADAELTPEARLVFSQSAAKAADCRNKAVDRLGLDRGTPDLASFLYGPAIEPGDDHATDTSIGRVGANPEADGEVGLTPPVPTCEDVRVEGQIDRGDCGLVRTPTHAGCRRDA